MQVIIGFLMIVAGICFGVYVGFWVCFVGGAVDIINEIKAPVTEIGPIAFGLFKMIFAYGIGWASGFFAILPGMGLIATAE